MNENNKPDKTIMVQYKNIKMKCNCNYFPKYLLEFV